MYDQKAGEMREQQEQIRQQIRTAEAMMIPPASEAVDLITLASKAADLFVAQTAGEQRKLLHLVLKEASWKAGELRMLLREPFQELRLSNCGSDRNSRDFDPNGSNFNNWRRGGDSNPRYRFKPVRRFSKPLLSTTQPPLRAVSRLLSASLGRCHYIILQFSSALLRGPPLGCATRMWEFF